MVKEHTHSKLTVICRDHSHETTQLLDDKQLNGETKIICGECGSVAYPLYIKFLGVHILNLWREIRKIKKALTNPEDVI